MTAPVPEPRVLVVDDSALVRQILHMTVRQIPATLYAQIDQADNGQAALDLIRVNRYDLVMADIRMPLLDGLELVRLVRQELKDSKTPIVLISTLGTEADVRRGIEAGATAYLVKPLSPYRIKKMIERIFRDRL
jgi:two-component system, chemotaxis family, chemotaxis protein CheY